MKEAFKRKPTIVICIGFVLYVISTCIPSLTLDLQAWSEATGRELRGGYGIMTIPLILIGFYYAVPVLIGLVELICVIANKKAVFVLSVIQIVVSVPVYAIMLLLLWHMQYISNDGEFVSKSVIVYLPIVASILLLVGGIMFRKEKAMSGGTN